jgi:hypothetical protein
MGARAAQRELAWWSSAGAGVAAGNARLVGIAAGDLRAAVSREVRSVVRDAHGDRYEAIKLGLKRIFHDGWVTERDLKSLNTLVGIVQSTAGKTDVPEAAVKKVRDTYHALLADSSSSPAALAIAAVINNLFTPTELAQAGGGVAYRIVIQDPQTGGALIGGVIGAVIGGALGGAVGAGVGAGLGGTIGGAVGECLD